jgi:hypothetical protein
MSWRRRSANTTRCRSRSVVGWRLGAVAAAAAHARASRRTQCQWPGAAAMRALCSRGRLPSAAASALRPGPAHPARLPLAAHARALPPPPPPPPPPRRPGPVDGGHAAGMRGADGQAAKGRQPGGPAARHQPPARAERRGPGGHRADVEPAGDVGGEARPARQLRRRAALGRLRWPACAGRRPARCSSLLPVAWRPPAGTTRTAGRRCWRTTRHWRRCELGAAPSPSRSSGNPEAQAAGGRRELGGEMRAARLQGRSMAQGTPSLGPEGAAASAPRSGHVPCDAPSAAAFRRRRGGRWAPDIEGISGALPGPRILLWPVQLFKTGFGCLVLGTRADRPRARSY